MEGCAAGWDDAREAADDAEGQAEAFFDYGGLRGGSANVRGT